VDGVVGWAINHIKPNLPPEVWRGFQDEIDEWHHSKKELEGNETSHPHWDVVVFPRNNEAVIWTSDIPFRIEITERGSDNYGPQVGPLELSNKGYSEERGGSHQVVLRSNVTKETEGRFTMFKYRATAENKNIEAYDPDIICGDPPF
jgi:hypothetical protein